MIKSNELRIGNFVHDRGGKVIRIDFFEHLEKGFDCKFGQKIFIEGEEVHPMTEYSDYANPIPLTEEWLLRFGFEVNNTESWYYKGNFRWSKVGRYWLWFGIPMHNDLFKHVHQLQNLYFALTEKELRLNDK